MRVLFTCWPAYGHLFPMLPLAHAARRAGHDVVVASGAEMAGPAREFEFWQVGPTHAAAAERYWTEHPEAAEMSPAEQIVSDLSNMFVPTGGERALDLAPRALAWGPDMVVHEPSELAGAIVAQQTGARHVVHGLGLFPAGLWPVLERPVSLLGEQWQLPGLASSMLDATYVDTVPARLQPGGPGMFRRVQQIRPGDGLNRGTPVDLGALPYSQTVYLTMGTVFNERPDVFGSALAGLASLPVNIVVTVGPDADMDQFGPQPDHVLVTDFIPQAALLPQVQLVVSHGGSGTVAGALAHGLPHLVLPQGADNFMNAEVLRNAGAGMAIPPDSATSEAIAGAAEILLTDKHFTVVAEEIQAEIHAMPSADEALTNLLA